MSEATDWDKLDELDRKARERTRKRTLAELNLSLDNDDGFQRLDAITDEEWAKAVQEDEEAGNAA